ncbi:MAG: response regulator receiver protein [Verrucomicrobia bacterium]|nr:response regulator receiver protein [Verrucomicrobiota bacterium]
MNFNGKILLVDDEAHIRKFVGLILKPFSNGEILEAANGEEAIAIYQRENPDLVLLDVNMPIMDGMETLRALKKIDLDCRVIMLTSLANRKSVEDALALGAVDYIRKDTPKEEIASALAETIETCFRPEGPSP